MNKSVCIFPLESSTEFLSPVYQEIMKGKNILGLTGDSSDDLFYDKLANVLKDPNVNTIIFLGHGCSTGLYGNNFSELISQQELSAINHKTLILFSCNSCQLMEKINAKKGIGFGFIPSGQIDIIHSTQFHNLDLSTFQTWDWACLREIYQNSWIRAIKLLNGNYNVYNLYKKLDLFLSRSIVDVLGNSSITKRRLISNLIFFVKKDMKFFGI